VGTCRVEPSENLGHLRQLPFDGIEALDEVPSP
jgi:hypothetical protein